MCIDSGRCRCIMKYNRLLISRGQRNGADHVTGLKGIVLYLWSTSCAISEWVYIHTVDTVYTHTKCQTTCRPGFDVAGREGKPQCSMTDRFSLRTHPLSVQQDRLCCLDEDGPASKKIKIKYENEEEFQLFQPRVQISWDAIKVNLRLFKVLKTNPTIWDISIPWCCCLYFE